MKETLKRKIGRIYILYKIRVARGSTFTAEIDSLVNSLQRAGIVFLIVDRYFHALAPFWLLPTLWLLQKIVEYFLGWFDQEHLHWQHFENEFMSYNLSPWNDEMLKLTKDINNKLNDYTNRRR